MQDVKQDFARLLRDASEGLPVGGRKAPWEAGRPTTVADLTAQARALLWMPAPGLRTAACKHARLLPPLTPLPPSPRPSLPLPLQKPRGFITYERLPLPYRPVDERLQDWSEVHAQVR